MNIKDMNKAKILAALYNNSRPLGMGFLQATPEDMTEDEAQALLNEGQAYFDYLKGRVMKVDLSKDELFTGLYNRDNGPNRCEEIIEGLTL